MRSARQAKTTPWDYQSQKAHDAHALLAVLPLEKALSGAAGPHSVATAVARAVLLLLWQERRLIGIQLHVEGGEQRRRPRVIGHQREINQSAGTEVSNAKVNLKEIRLIPLSQVGQYVV
jgi:hypothetical protein